MQRVLEKGFFNKYGEKEDIELHVEVYTLSKSS